MSLNALLLTAGTLAIVASGKQLNVDMGHMSPDAIGKQDLVFFHVPMNFGNSIALTAGVGSGSTLTYSQVSGAAKQGWDMVTPMLQANAPVWGPLHPDLQMESDLGYPMYYTPASRWPKDLAEQYFGNKTVFGLLRDPYERVVAKFKATKPAVRGWDFTPDGKDCTDQLNQKVKVWLTSLVQDPSQIPNVNLAVQADYFEGPYAITLAVDLDDFPNSANQLLQEHGYNLNIHSNDMLHVHGCDNTWSGDLDDDAKSLIKQYYARDFKLRCDLLGYCDDSSDHCLTRVPGMCPDKLFAWDPSAEMYKLRE